MDEQAPDRLGVRPGPPDNMQQRPHAGPPPAAGYGNTRVTVAFPFSKIEIRESAALADLAVMVCRLAGQVAEVARAAAPTEAEAAGALTAEATALARRLGATP